MPALIATLFGLLLEHMPDVARALAGAADRGELDESTVSIVRAKVPAVSDSEKLRDELKGIT